MSNMTINPKQDETETSESSTEKSESNINISEINTIEQLTKFEEELAKEDFEKEVYQYWTQRLGTDMGAGYGKNKAFILSDSMFSRHFFTLCSWTGQSTSTEGNKVSFKSYKRTVDIFWKIVNNCDNTYSCEMNKTFLQGLMNKAKFRVEEAPSGMRKRSATKNRPKNLKYNRKTKKEENQQTDNEKDEEPASKIPKKTHDLENKDTENDDAVDAVDGVGEDDDINIE